MGTTTIVILIAIGIMGVIFYEWFYNLLKPDREEINVITNYYRPIEKIYSITDLELRTQLGLVLVELERIEKGGLFTKQQIAMNLAKYRLLQLINNAKEQA